MRDSGQNPARPIAPPAEFETMTTWEKRVLIGAVVFEAALIVLFVWKMLTR